MAQKAPAPDFKAAPGLCGAAAPPLPAKTAGRRASGPRSLWQGRNGAARMAHGEHT